MATTTGTIMITPPLLPIFSESIDTNDVVSYSEVEGILVVFE